ncbi:MAG TPA: amino acid permease [Blastocatellia bacterium]|nr:amino acid permease [Blastocatellia bacterium]
METSTDQKSEGAAETRRRTALPRRLGLISAMAVLVGSTIGTGIFRSPAGIATKVPDEGLYLLLWVLGGFFSLCGALTLAELAGALPHTGGVFVFLREGFGRLPAFLFGWSELVIIRASALGAISTVFAEYALRLLGSNDAQAVHYVAAAAILVTATFNIIGVKLGSVVQNLTTGTKYAALVVLVLAAFLIGGRNDAPANAPAALSADQIATDGAALSKNDVVGLLGGGVPASRVREVIEARGVSFRPSPEILNQINAVGGDGSLEEAISRTAPSLIALFGLAFISLLWVYDGWADVTFMSGEVKRPERFLPLALICGTLAVVTIYMLANFAYLHLLTIGQIADSRLVAADAAFRIVGDTGVNLISIAVMISAFGTLNGSMMTGPRIFFAMADEGLFFKNIASVHPRFKTPYIAISLAATIAIVFVLVRTFEQLADTFVLAIWPFYAGGVAAVYALRRKRPDLPRAYRTPGYPVTPALFILAVLLLVGNAIWSDLRYYAARFAGGPNPHEWSGALMVFTIVLAGIPAYFIWKRMNPDR